LLPIVSRQKNKFVDWRNKIEELYHLDFKSVTDMDLYVVDGCWEGLKAFLRNPVKFTNERIDREIEKRKRRAEIEERRCAERSSTSSSEDDGRGVVYQEFLEESIRVWKEMRERM